MRARRGGSRGIIGGVVILAVAGATLTAPVVAKERTLGLEKIEVQLLQEMDAAEARGDGWRVYVNLRPRETGGELADAFTSPANEAMLRANVREVQDAVLSERGPGRFEVLYRYDTVYGFSALVDTAALRALAAHDDVESIERIPQLVKMDAQSLPLTNTDDAHALGFTGAGVTIAIIDDGIDHDHAAFGGQSAWPNSKILGGRDFADNDSDPRIDCTAQSHGTAVAGVAAGNGGGITGTGKDAKLVFLKIQSAGICGSASLDGDIVGAIDWAVANRSTYGIKIISMSLGTTATYSGTCDSSQTAYRNAINAAVSAGITVLAASGNGAVSNGMSAPACIANAMSVGAVYDANIGSANFGLCSDSTTAADKITCYSNSGSQLDILAPSHCALTAQAGGGQTTCFGGTSSATPFSAGVAAVLLDKDGGLTPTEIRGLLKDNGQPITDSRNGLTRSRVDSLASLNAIDGGGGGGNELENGVPVSGISGAQTSQQFWTVDIPAGASNLQIQISGGSGDADLYVRFGSPPTTSTWDCRPYLNGNNETCSFPTPSAGTYHVMLRGYTTYSGVTLTATWTEGGGGGCTPGGGTVPNLSGGTGSQSHYTLSVPACASTLTVRIFGGSGDADLYVRHGAQPTLSTWDCRPYLWGNNETCTFNDPAAGTWHIMLRGYTSYSGVTLDADYE
jgi:serine protease